MTPRTDVEQQIRASVLRCWCEILGSTEHEVSDSSGFFDHGTSVQAIRFLAAVSSELDVDAPVDPLFLDGTFGAFVAAVVDTVLPGNTWRLDNAG